MESFCYNAEEHVLTWDGKMEKWKNMQLTKAVLEHMTYLHAEARNINNSQHSRYLPANERNQVPCVLLKIQYQKVQSGRWQFSIDN